LSKLDGVVLEKPVQNSVTMPSRRDVDPTESVPPRGHQYVGYIAASHPTLPRPPFGFAHPGDFPIANRYHLFGKLPFEQPATYEEEWRSEN
jgi:hypothetical protein